MSVTAESVSSAGTSGLEVDPDLEAMLDKLFAGIDPAAPAADPGGAVDRSLWTQLAGLGLTDLTTPEERGGSGAGWPEAWALHRAAARHAVPLPLGEHDVLGRWLAGRLGWDSGDDVLSVGVAAGEGTEVTVPWGAGVDTVLMVRVLDEGAQVCRHPSTDLAWSTRGQLPVTRRASTRPAAESSWIPLSADVLDELRLRGALLRSVQVVGALERCVELAVEHAAVRVQFGRTLSAFQAVQGLLADAASEVALARAAVVAAVREAAATDDLRAAGLAIAVAASCSGHAVAPVTRSAHQVLGAIGTTREHPLHLFSMPALAWRDDYGTPSEWDAVLGSAVDRDGLTAPWRRLVGGTGRG